MFEFEFFGEVIRRVNINSSNKRFVSSKLECPTFYKCFRSGLDFSTSVKSGLSNIDETNQDIYFRSALGYCTFFVLCILLLSGMLKCTFLIRTCYEEH